MHDCVLIHSHNHTVANDAGYLLYKSDNCCSPRAMRAGVCLMNRCSGRGEKSPVIIARLVDHIEDRGSTPQEGRGPAYVLDLANGPEGQPRALEDVAVKEGKLLDDRQWMDS